MSKDELLQKVGEIPISKQAEFKIKQLIINYESSNLKRIEGLEASLLYLAEKSCARVVELEQSLKDREWKYGDVPKDGGVIIRWHIIWKCAVCVYYKPGFSKHESCVWLNSDRSNAWPEESFLPDAWMNPPSTPNTPSKSAEDKK